MQLFSVGLNSVNMDGTEILDENGFPKETYTIEGTLVHLYCLHFVPCISYPFSDFRLTKLSSFYLFFQISCHTPGTLVLLNVYTLFMYFAFFQISDGLNCLPSTYSFTGRGRASQAHRIVVDLQ